VVGPAWTATGQSPVDAGRFPLGVETATLSNAARLVPGVNSGTAHARYYTLHAYVAAQGQAQHEAGEDLEHARGRVRRAEVVLAAVSLRHAQLAPAVHHGGVGMREPHGARLISPELQHETLDVKDLATRYSRQPGGFLDVYRGAEITLGLLDGVAGTLAPGPVTLPEAAVAPLEAVALASARDQMPIAAVDALLPEGCICAVRSSAEGEGLRELLFGGPAAPAAPSSVRRARARTARSARLLLVALVGQPLSVSPDQALSSLCCFSDLESVSADDQQRTWALYWRGALLRNASVTAWRWLWWWITEQLRIRPRSAAEVGQALADALVAAAGSDSPARETLLNSLPARSVGGRLQDAESAILYPDGLESSEPFDYLRCLALGALRLDDLEGPAKTAFCESAELGPMWVRRWLDGLGDQPLSVVGLSLASFLLRQAEEISRRRARWEPGPRLRLPTRLRQVGEVLDLAGEEGSIAPGLRLGRLAQILGELDVLSASADVFCRGAAVDQQW
jgi:hypothetical protein